MESREITYPVAGDYTDKSGNVLRAVIHWNYHTISRGDDSLFSQLTKIEGGAFNFAIIGSLTSFLL